VFSGGALCLASQIRLRGVNIFDKAVVQAGISVPHVVKSHVGCCWKIFNAPNHHYLALWFLVPWLQIIIIISKIM
jgi:hypothetical protein